MKRLILLALLLAPGAVAQNETAVRSPFGFELRVPGDWDRSASGDMIFLRAPWEEGEEPTLALLVLPRAGGEVEAAVGEMAANLQASEEIDFLLQEKIELGGRTAHALRYRIRSASRSIWQVAVALEGEAALVLTFGSADDVFEEKSPLFEKAARTLAFPPPRAAGAGLALYRHPLGISFEIPESWTVETLGNKVYFAPPGHEGERYPLVLAVTGPAPEELDTLAEIEEFITKDLDEADVSPDLSSESWLGDVEARVVTWTVASRREVVRQTGLVWKGALVVLTGTSPTAKLGELEPVFERAEESWRFE